MYLSAMPEAKGCIYCPLFLSFSMTCFMGMQYWFSNDFFLNIGIITNSFSNMRIKLDNLTFNLNLGSFKAKLIRSYIWALGFS
jgi:hypothetical protein